MSNRASYYIDSEGPSAQAVNDAFRWLLKNTKNKGFIAVDGVSLTIADLDDVSFAVSLVTYTMEGTTLGGRRPGDIVNLEADILAKYVENLREREKNMIQECDRAIIIWQDSSSVIAENLERLKRLHKPTFVCEYHSKTNTFRFGELDPNRIYSHWYYITRASEKRS